MRACQLLRWCADNRFYYASPFPSSVLEFQGNRVQVSADPHWACPLPLLQQLTGGSRLSIVSWYNLGGLWSTGCRIESPTIGPWMASGQEPEGSVTSGPIEIFSFSAKIPTIWACQMPRFIRPAWIWEFESWSDGPAYWTELGLAL